METFLRRLVFILTAATFTMPLFVAPTNFIFPFIVPKILVFRSITLLMAGAYLLLLFGGSRSAIPRMTKITAVVGLFFWSMIVSTFVGVDWYKSFWDNHERMLGLFTLFHFILYYAIVTTVIREAWEWRWLFRLFLFFGSVVMIIGMWQKLVDPSALLNQGSNRVSGTLGNPIYYSGYGLFLFFSSCLLIAREKLAGWKLFAILGAMLGFIGIFFGGTRGTLLGLLSAGGFLFLWYAFFMTHAAARKWMWGAALGVVALLGVLFVFRTTPTVQGLPAIGPLLNVSFHGGTASTRLMAWGIAMEAWKAHPIFGWGPNNFYYAFNQYYRPQFLEHGYGETWFDSAHNLLLNTLAVQGAFGVIFYVGLFGVPIFVVIQRYRRGRLDMHTTGLSVGFLIAHFVHNAFVFENPTSYMYFFFFLAFLNQEGQEGGERKESWRGISIPAGCLITIMILIGVYATDINPARANMKSLLTIRTAYAGSPKTLELYRQSEEAPSPHFDDIRNDFARVVSQVLPAFVQAKRTVEAKELLRAAMEELRKNRSLHPLDIRVHIQQAQLAMLGLQLFQDPEYMAEGEAALEDALTKSPKRQQILYMLANIKLQKGQIEEGVKLIERSINDDPVVGEGWWRMAIVYQELGQKEKAREIILTGKQAGALFPDENIIAPFLS
ncbi:MAG: O-antigen ligase family protein, partial [Patescibacteria group bacterium]